MFLIILLAHQYDLNTFIVSNLL